jgi:hypothetical protein
MKIPERRAAIAAAVQKLNTPSLCPLCRTYICEHRAPEIAYATPKRRTAMDPNEALKRCREMIGGKDNRVGSSEVVEAFQALDGWLSRGGFLPQDWTLAGDRNRLIRPFDILLCEACDTDREVAAVTDGIIRFRVCGHVQP